MADFNLAKSLVIAAEGGYSNDPNDFGGETKYGISKRQYPHLDIKNLTIEEACDIYLKDYWNKYRINEIKDQIIANQIFLMFVNINPKTVGVIVQSAIAHCGGVLLIDEVIGSKSIALINSLHQEWLSDYIRVELVQFYVNQVTMDKSQLKFLEGWIRRALA